MVGNAFGLGWETGVDLVTTPVIIDDKMPVYKVPWWKRLLPSFTVLFGRHHHLKKKNKPVESQIGLKKKNDSSFLKKGKCLIDNSKMRERMIEWMFFWTHRLFYNSQVMAMNIFFYLSWLFAYFKEKFVLRRLSWLSSSKFAFDSECAFMTHWLLYNGHVVPKKDFQVDSHSL